ncbi:MAG: hypothetical protein ACI9DF_005287 [Verrucomicrobiales bacterium]|jgi:hypothetical protein
MPFADQIHDPALREALISGIAHRWSLNRPQEVRHYLRSQPHISEKRALQLEALLDR